MGSGIINERSMEEYTVGITIKKKSEVLLEKVIIINDFKSANEFYEEFVTPLLMKMDGEELINHFDDFNIFILLLINDLDKDNFKDGKINIEIKQYGLEYEFDITK